MESHSQQLLVLLVVVALSGLVDAANDCGFSDADRWRNWDGTITTKNSVIYPKTEQDVVDAVATARMNNCKVRAAGSGHTANGVVNQKHVDNVLVLDLEDMETLPSWDGILDEGNGRIRMAAGKTLLDLMAVARPKGFLNSVQTPVWVFSLAGVFMNPSVHGGTKGKGHLFHLVTGLRVLKADGTIMEILDEATLRIWRGSMGLLGIVLAVEVQLREDTGLNMFTTSHDLSGWDEPTVTGTLEEIDDGSDSWEMFYNPYNDQAVVMRATNSGSSDSFDPEETTKFYEKLQEMGPREFLTGILGALGGTDLAQGSKLWSRLIVEFTMLFTPVFWNTNRRERRDLYFIEVDIFDSALFELLVPWENRFAALDATRTIVQNTIADHFSDFYPNLPIELRVVDKMGDDVAQDNLFETLPTPGRYLSLTLDALRDSDKEMWHVEMYSAVEQALLPLGARPHIGKSNAYGPVGGLPNECPFQNEQVLDMLFDDSRRLEIQAAMNTWDPNGVFCEGGALRLVGLSGPEYDPRSFIGETCSHWNDDECFEGCCCDDWFQCGGLFLGLFGHGKLNECTATGRPNGDGCDVDCQCSSGICRSSFLSFGKSCQA